MKAWHLESGLARLLGLGTWVACVLLSVGLVLRATGAPAIGTQLLRAGIGVIIALPVVRVAMMAWHFTRDRQWRFAAIAAAVLLIIGIGIAAGLTAA